MLVVARRGMLTDVRLPYESHTVYQKPLSSDSGSPKVDRVQVLFLLLHMLKTGTVADISLRVFYS